MSYAFLLSISLTRKSCRLYDVGIDRSQKFASNQQCEHQRNWEILRWRNLIVPPRGLCPNSSSRKRASNGRGMQTHRWSFYGRVVTYIRGWTSDKFDMEWDRSWEPSGQDDDDNDESSRLHPWVIFTVQYYVKRVRGSQERCANCGCIWA